MTLHELNSIPLGAILKPSAKMVDCKFKATSGILKGLAHGDDPELIRVMVDGKQTSEVWNICFWDKDDAK